MATALCLLGDGHRKGRLQHRPYCLENCRRQPPVSWLQRRGYDKAEEARRRDRNLYLRGKTELG